MGKVRRKNSCSIVLGVIACCFHTCVALAVGNTEPSPLSEDESRTYSSVSTILKRSLAKPVSDRKIFNSCISGMVSGVDPESAYIDSEGFDNLLKQGGTTGVGLELDASGGYPTVVAPIEDGPAYEGGVKTGDVVIKIDNSSTNHMPLVEMVRHLRGPAGSQVRLTIKRPGEIQPIRIILTRAMFNTKSVKFRLLEPNYGYIRISQFVEHTGISIARALQSLREQNGQDLSGLILDLRNNPGGLLTSAFVVTSIFLPQNTLIAYTEGRDPNDNRRYLSGPEKYLRLPREVREFSKPPASVQNLPLVVLVNGGSAAGSEIVAGALQDHKRARILGTPTFGRDSLQTILPLSGHTALKLTTAHWFSPNGRSASPDGISPDIVVGENLSTGHDYQLEQAMLLLKATKDQAH